MERKLEKILKEKEKFQKLKDKLKKEKEKEKKLQESFIQTQKDLLYEIFLESNLEIDEYIKKSKKMFLDEKRQIEVEEIER